MYVLFRYGNPPDDLSKEWIAMLQGWCGDPKHSYSWETHNMWNTCMQCKITLHHGAFLSMTPGSKWTRTTNDSWNRFLELRNMRNALNVAGSWRLRNIPNIHDHGNIRDNQITSEQTKIVTHLHSTEVKTQFSTHEHKIPRRSKLRVKDDNWSCPSGQPAASTQYRCIGDNNSTCNLAWVVDHAKTEQHSIRSTRKSSPARNTAGATSSSSWEAPRTWKRTQQRTTRSWRRPSKCKWMAAGEPFTWKREPPAYWLKFSIPPKCWKTKASSPMLTQSCIVSWASRLVPWLTSVMHGWLSRSIFRSDIFWAPWFLAEAQCASASALWCQESPSTEWHWLQKKVAVVVLCFCKRGQKVVVQ